MPQTATPMESAQLSLRPLCVDLDGTLVKSDTLVDSLLTLVRTNPLLVLKLPGKLIRGKAAFKAFVTQSTSLDIAHLPYNKKVLKYLREQHAEGRPLYLATGADIALAQSVADHLGIFQDVLGSHGAINLTGNRKLDGLRSRLGQLDFDYIGNASPDLPLLAHAKEPMLANPSLALKIRLRLRGIKPTHEFLERRDFLRSLVRAVRPHQWAKNTLIFLPVLLSHSIGINRLRSALLAFFCFSLCASATYIVNDLLDIDSDRRHQKKRSRPFAAGDLYASTGATISFVLLVFAFGFARLLPLHFLDWLLLYFGMTLAYSTYLKRVPLVDVLILSGLYTLRLLGGSAATNTHISHWLGSFSVFLFLSLGIAKRFAELQSLNASSSVPRNGRGYLLTDLNQLQSFGTSSAFSAVVIFSIYISGPEVSKLYDNPTLLWLIMPFMVLWLSRVWLLASRGELNEDPVVFALTDRMSLLIGVAVVIIALLAI